MKAKTKSKLNNSVLLIVFLTVLLFLSAFFFLYQSLQNTKISNLYNSISNSNIKLVSEIHEENRFIAKKNSPNSILYNSNPTLAGFLSKDGNFKIASNSQVK